MVNLATRRMKSSRRDRFGLQEAHALLTSPAFEHAVEHGRCWVEECDVLREYEVRRSRYLDRSIHTLHLTQRCGAEFARGRSR